MKATLPASIVLVLCACTGLALLLLLAPVAGVAQANQDYATDDTWQDLEAAEEDRDGHQEDLKAKEAEQDRLEKAGASHREKQKVAAEANALRDKVAAAQTQILKLKQNLRVEAPADLAKAFSAAEKGNPADHLKKAKTLCTRWESGLTSYALPAHSAWKQPAGPPTPENVKEAETAKSSLEAVQAELEQEQDLIETELASAEDWLDKQFPLAAAEWARVKSALEGIKTKLEKREKAVSGLLDKIRDDLQKIDDYVS